MLSSSRRTARRCERNGKQRGINEHRLWLEQEGAGEMEGKAKGKDKMGERNSSSLLGQGREQMVTNC